MIVSIPKSNNSFLKWIRNSKSSEELAIALQSDIHVIYHYFLFRMWRNERKKKRKKERKKPDNQH